MASQADKILAMMEHRADVAGKEAVQNVSNELQAALHELTPKRIGETDGALAADKER